MPHDSDGPLPSARLPMMLVVLLVVAGLLAGCSETAPSADLSQAQLEQQMLKRFPAKNGSTKVEVSCDGGLEARAGASQICRLEVGGDPAQVRVDVSAASGDDLVYDATPVVPAVRVARAVRRALLQEGYLVDQVVCPDQVMGVVGESVTCRVKPANDRGEVEATVASVKGLAVRFRYDIVADPA